MSYFLKQKEYLSINPSKEVEIFFEKNLKENYDNLNNLLEKILLELKNNQKIEIYIKGYASPLYESNYNFFGFPWKNSKGLSHRHTLLHLNFDYPTR